MMGKDTETHRWIKINDRKFESTKEIVEGGVVFRIYVSPYDRPEAVRGSYCEPKDRFVIEFRYIGDEKKESRAVGKSVTFRIGKNSKRVYAIEADVKRLRVESVVLHVSHAIDELSKMLEGKKARVPAENFELVKSAVADNALALMRDLDLTTQGAAHQPPQIA